MTYKECFEWFLYNQADLSCFGDTYIPEQGDKEWQQNQEYFKEIFGGYASQIVEPGHYLHLHVCEKSNYHARDFLKEHTPDMFIDTDDCTYYFFKLEYD